MAGSALEQYEIGHIIGRGQFGEVRVADHRTTGRRTAVKHVERCKMDPQKMEQEISNHRLLQHPHVVQLYEVIETRDDVYMFQELVSGGDLFDYIVAHTPRLQEPEARSIFCQIVAAVAHCHSRMVVHRDLKPENIMLDDDTNVKLADFGLSGLMIPGQQLTESCGSPNYAAPEMYQRNCAYEGPEVDVWSCGVLQYALLCGQLPFDEDNIEALVKKIRDGRYKVPGYVANDAKNLIAGMLTVEPLKRLSLFEVQSHSWFTKEIMLVSLQECPLAAPLDAPAMQEERECENVIKAFHSSIEIAKCETQDVGVQTEDFRSYPDVGVQTDGVEPKIALSHLGHRVQVLLQALGKHVDPEKPFIHGARELAKELDLEFTSALNVVQRAETILLGDAYIQREIKVCPPRKTNSRSMAGVSCSELNAMVCRNQGWGGKRGRVFWETRLRQVPTWPRQRPIEQAQCRPSHSFTIVS
jgi:5'-AMP-activated protein kinase catalytic alpha subunit